jgi:hypothetical protein
VPHDVLDLHDRIVDQDADNFRNNEQVVTFVESEEQLAKRAALEECLQDIHEVIREWKECLITLPTQGLQPGSQGKQQFELPVKDAGHSALLGGADCGKQQCEQPLKDAGVAALLPLPAKAFGGRKRGKGKKRDK